MNLTSMINSVKLLPDLLYMVTQWLLILTIRVPLMVLGLFLVPIGLKYSTTYLKTKQHFNQYNKGKMWYLETLPNWLWLWSNDRDGARGDKRGWWDWYSGGSEKFWSKYQWLAIRNPVHNLAFVPYYSCDVSKATEIKVLAGSHAIDYKVIKSGFQWIRCTSQGINYYHLYWVRPSKKDSKKGLYLRMGHKFKIEHTIFEDESGKQWKKFTFRFRPYTDLH